MVYSLVEDSIVYHSNESPDEDLIYKNLRKKRKLEQLIEGVRSGRQYLYTLLLEFESKELLKGRLAVPFNKNFYDESDGTGRDCASCGAESVPFLNISAE